MHLPTQNILAWEGELFLFFQIQRLLISGQPRIVSVTLFHLLVVAATFLRLVHRWRTKQLWWDDYSAFIVLLVDITFVIIMWWRFRNGGKHLVVESVHAQETLTNAVQLLISLHKWVKVSCTQLGLLCLWD